MPEKELKRYDKVLARARKEQDAALGPLRAVSETVPIVVATLEEHLARAREIGVPEPDLAAFSTILEGAKGEQDRAVSAMRAAAEARPVVIATLEECLKTARTVGVPKAAIAPYKEALASAKAEQDGALEAVNKASKAKPIVVATLEEHLTHAQLVGVPDTSLKEHMEALRSAQNDQEDALSAVTAAGERNPIVVAKLEECLASARKVGVPERSMDKYIQALAAAKTEQDAALAAVKQVYEARPLVFDAVEERIMYAEAIGVPMASLTPFSDGLVKTKSDREEALKAVRAAGEAKPVVVADLEKSLKRAREVEVPETHVLDKYDEVLAAAKVKAEAEAKAAADKKAAEEAAAAAKAAEEAAAKAAAEEASAPAAAKAPAAAPATSEVKA